MATAPVLCINDLYLHFPVYEGLARVLDGVSLYVDQGERVGLAGETGCGKSVTMKTALGIIKSPPAVVPHGEVLLLGHNVLMMPGRELDRMKGNLVSMVFQDPLSSLNPVFTVGQQLFDVIKFGHRSAGGDTPLRRRDVRSRAVEILSEVRLPDPQRVLAAYPFTLSGGMRQRILIAMALVNRPRLLIADEPGTALDVTIQAQILQLLRVLVDDAGIGVLLVTHDLGVIREMAERVYIMYAGQIAEHGGARDVLEDPGHPYARGLLGAVPRFTGGVLAEGIEGTVPEYTMAPPGCRFHPRCPSAMPECSQHRPTVCECAPGHFVSCHLFTAEAE